MKVKQLEQENWKQTDEFYTKFMQLVRIASIATPGMFILEDVAANLVVKTLKCTTFCAIDAAVKMDRRGFRLLEQYCALIKVYTNELFFVTDDYQPSPDEPKRITVINPGNFATKL